MHYIDANKTAGKEARRQLHKIAASNIEQVLAATPYKTPTIGHLPPITKTIQFRRTRHAEHCWRSRDKLISDVLLWTPTYGRSKARRPARTYIQQLCEDTGCSPEDQPEVMNDREKWRERVRDIRSSCTRWWDDDDYYFSLLRVSLINVNGWFFMGVWETAGCLNCMILFTILADLSNAVWIVSTRLISKSSSPCNSLVTVPNEPITIGIYVTFMLHSFLSSQASSKYYLHFRFPLVLQVVCRYVKFDYSAGSHIFVDYHCVWSSGSD